ncbi:MAG: sulfurtransferase [Candidatus Acidiferrales bacterium]
MASLSFVSADWVANRLDSPEFLFLDPRSPLRYMAGHPKNAVSAPIAKARAADGALLPPEKLASWLASLGLDDHRTPVLYDGADGRNAAMLAWLLMYLGRTDVHIMETFFEEWLAEKREVFYRPVVPAPGNFSARLKPQLRVTAGDLRDSSSVRLVDFRSVEEFTGQLTTDGRPGHIPGAVNLPWNELNGAQQKILAPREKLAALFASRGIAPDRPAVAYCRTGVRAALGFLALAEIGLPVALYDGSFADWAHRGLPVETSEFEERKANA